VIGDLDQGAEPTGVAKDRPLRSSSSSRAWAATAAQPRAACGVPEVRLSRELRRCAGCQPHGTTPSSEMASPATILRIVASSVRATVDLRWSAATATRFRPCRP
jgi:hypothetical protein